MQRSMRRMNVPENWMLKSGESFKTLIAEKFHLLEGNINSYSCMLWAKKNQYAQTKQPNIKTASRSSARKINGQTLPESCVLRIKRQK